MKPHSSPDHTGSINPTARPASGFELRGGHVATFFIAFFGIIFAVNFLMASLASGSWTGLIAKNGYVASKDLAIEHRKRRLALAAGWLLHVSIDDGVVVVKMDGLKSSPDDLIITAKAERPLNEADDVPLVMERAGRALWRSEQALPDGRWTIVATVSQGDYEITERLSLLPERRKATGG